MAMAYHSEKRRKPEEIWCVSPGGGGNICGGLIACLEKIFCFL
jgi:hypothetical protein